MYKVFRSVIAFLVVQTAAIMLAGAEIEIKFQLDSATTQILKNALQAKTGSAGSVSQQTDTYVLPSSLPYHDGFYDPQEFVRIRQDSKKGNIITYKLLHRDEKTTTHRTELETKIGDAQTIIEIMKTIIPDAQQVVITKEREKYVVPYNGAMLEVVFDHTFGLGNFIEIELKTDMEVVAGRNLIKNFLKETGISSITEITKNYIHLALNPTHQDVFKQVLELI